MSEDRSKCPRCGSAGAWHDNAYGKWWSYDCDSRYIPDEGVYVHTDLCDLILMTADRDRWQAKFEQFCRDTTDGLDCLPGCNSNDHEDDCPLTNPSAAFRKLQADIALWKARAEKLRDAVNDFLAEYDDGGWVDVQPMVEALHELEAGDANNTRKEVR